ncbi:MAG: PQQ-dependent sugar dehydrogenase [candidate division KSB1 bacterium]|nr:PQQ-dependent sugar dehydrogenase [candidate division KSB1 bacterium]
MNSLKTVFSALFILFVFFSGIIPAAAQEITLPDGFKATIFADNVGRARQIIVNDNGDVYIMLREPNNGGGVVALRDADKDGQADEIEYFAPFAGTGIDIYQGYLYVAPDTAVYRYKLTPGELLPQSQPEPVITGLQEQRQHAAKPITFDKDGHLYLNIGGPSNACQESMRSLHSPGLDPCPQLKKHAGIWQFDANKLNQTLENDSEQYCTGIRHCVAVDYNHSADKLYAVMHGRDQLNTLWPRYYDDQDNAELPAEEFLLIEKGDDFGWPYCYYDGRQDKKVLAPEYGGDGEKIGRCADAKDPIMAFPAHWAPNDLIFYTGDQFPKTYKNGAFVAFHGSWNRAPKPQQGYKVVFVPFDGAYPAGDWQVFADNFARTEKIISTRDAEYRPMGLAQGPDGELYITDSQKGRVWKVTYKE